MTRSDDRPSAQRFDAPGDQLVLDDGVLDEHARVIKTLGRRVVGDVIEIGRRLTECKRRIEEREGRGHWLPWLRREFDWSESTAERYMRVNALAESVTVTERDLPDLPLGGLYLLASPKTPRKTAEEVVTRARAGERFTTGGIAKAVGDAKADAKAKAKAKKAARAARERTRRAAKSGEKHSSKRAIYQQRSHMWRSLRAALDGLTALPAARDVVDMMRKTPQVSPLINAKLAFATAWLNSFNSEWRRK
jgi:hypothetical protein